GSRSTRARSKPGLAKAERDHFRSRGSGRKKHPDPPAWTVASAAGLNEARFVRVDHGLDSIAQTELEQEMRDVRLHSALADHELGRSRTGGRARRDERADLARARRQLVQLCR